MESLLSIPVKISSPVTASREAKIGRGKWAYCNKEASCRSFVEVVGGSPTRGINGEKFFGNRKVRVTFKFGKEILSL